MKEKDLYFSKHDLAAWIRKCARSIHLRLNEKTLVPNWIRMSFAEDLIDRTCRSVEYLESSLLDSIKSTSSPAHIAKVCYFLSYGLGLKKPDENILSIIAKLLSCSSYAINPKLLYELSTYRTSSIEKQGLEQDLKIAANGTETFQITLRLSAALRILAELRNFDDHTASINCHGLYTLGSLSFINYDYFNLNPKKIWGVNVSSVEKAIKLRFIHRGVKSRFDQYGNYYPEIPLTETLWGVVVKIEDEIVNRNELEKFSQHIINKVKTTADKLKHDYLTRNNSFQKRFAQYHYRVVAKALDLADVEEWKESNLYFNPTDDKTNELVFKKMALKNVKGLEALADSLVAPR